MFSRRFFSMLIPLSLIGLLALAGRATADSGAEIYRTKCIQCHGSGILSAPKLGDAADWAERRKKGADALTASAIEGINQMPPKGGSVELSDEAIGLVVVYMLSQLPAAAGAEPATPAQARENPAKAVAAGASGPRDATDSTAGPKRVAVSPKPGPRAGSRAEGKDRKRQVNAFNRLMRPPSQRNLPPMRDGIHDASNDGTATLQHPKEAFSPMPKSNSGNRVDWVAALEKGHLNPRFDIEDETRKPIVLDLNIIREVKGSMPDVVYPHKQHTEWLDCSNCHPSIFIPKKGANNISMASILLGQQCGVCHGKVAFPVSECRKCHSKNKPKEAGQ